MKVRIGNDIRLHVTLLGDRTTDYVNIKSVHAYLVNTTRQNDIDEQHRHDSIDYADKLEERRGLVKYVSRFPAEPDYFHHHHHHRWFHRPYSGTPYDLMHCGHPTFHVRPVYCVAPYIGFGVHPHTFDPYHNHLWGYDDLQDLHAKMMYKEEDYKRQYSECEFLAPVTSSSKPNKVYVDFPAECQHYTGTYKLIIIAKLYQPGYGKDDLRTVTMDYMDIFTLVGHSEDGLDQNVTIDVGNCKDASGIEVVGNTVIPVGGRTILEAVVLPEDIDNTKVDWGYVNNADIEYVYPISKDDTRITLRGEKLPEGEQSHIVKLKVSSRKTPGVYKIIDVILVNEMAVDKHVNATSFSSEGVGNDRRDFINLNVVGLDNPVQVETTKETVWYED